MLKRIMLFSLLLVLAACSGQAIFSEKFTDITELPDILHAENLVAAPDAQSDVLHLVVPQSGLNQSGFLYIQLDENQNTYDVTMSVHVISGSVRLWARTRINSCAGYALILDPIRDNYRLSVADGCDLQTIDSRSQLDVNNEFTYEMRIVVDDEMVQGYVDGVKYFEAPADAFPTGIPAIEVINDRVGVGQVDIDILTVK